MTTSKTRGWYVIATYQDRNIIDILGGPYATKAEAKRQRYSASPIEHDGRRQIEFYGVVMFQRLGESHRLRYPELIQEKLL
jgi:hypothetical protein